jgi:hypothetical protein
MRLLNRQEIVGIYPKSLLGLDNLKNICHLSIVRNLVSVKRKIKGCYLLVAIP